MSSDEEGSRRADRREARKGKEKKVMEKWRRGMEAGK